jgi:hypothetical protein
MSARDPIFSACEKWRDLTTTEGRAIEASDWVVVAECQREKKHLQSVLTGLSGPPKPGWATGAPRFAEMLDAVRVLAAELIAMETRNANLLARKREAALTARGELERSGMNLRRIRGSYGGLEPGRRRFEHTV